MKTVEEMMLEDVADIKSEGPSDHELVEISTLVEELVYWQEWKEKLDVKMATVEQNIRAIAEVMLPAALAEANCSEYKLHDGRKVTSRQHIYASIPEGKQRAAFDWLRQNKLDGVIKNVVQVDFVKGEDAKVAELIKLIAEAGLQPERKETVHPMTLKALLREQREKGVDVPLDIFGAHVVTRAEVK